jgi:hypothetical protein
VTKEGRHAGLRRRVQRCRVLVFQGRSPAAVSMARGGAPCCDLETQRHALPSSKVVPAPESVCGAPDKRGFGMQHAGCAVSQRVCSGWKRSSAGRRRRAASASCATSMSDATRCGCCAAHGERVQPGADGQPGTGGGLKHLTGARGPGRTARPNVPTEPRCSAISEVSVLSRAHPGRYSHPTIKRAGR